MMGRGGLVRKLLGISLLALSGCAGSYAQRPAAGVNDYSVISNVLREVEKNVQYIKKDPFDYWQTPLETKRRGGGDCEDLAFYIQDCLREKGVPSRVAFGSYYYFINPHAWIELGEGPERELIDFEDYHPLKCTIINKDYPYFNKYKKIFPNPYLFFKQMDLEERMNKQHKR